MARRSQEDEIVEALANMPKWQRKTAWSILSYGLIITILGMVSFAMPWILWHKILLYASIKPLKAFELLVMPTALGSFVFFVVLPMIWNSSMTMLRSAREEERRCAAEPDEVMLQ